MGYSKTARNMCKIALRAKARRRLDEFINAAKSGLTKEQVMERFNLNHVAFKSYTIRNFGSSVWPHCVLSDAIDKRRNITRTPVERIEAQQSKINRLDERIGRLMSQRVTEEDRLATMLGELT